MLWLLLGPCQATGPPARPITEEQLQVLHRTFDALQEEVAAARTPSASPLILFGLTLLLPLAAGVWLLVRAERSVIGADETLRTLVRCGLAEPVVRHYLAQRSPPALPNPRSGSDRPQLLPQGRPRTRRRTRRRRRRRHRGRP